MSVQNTIHNDETLSEYRRPYGMLICDIALTINNNRMQNIKEVDLI